MEKKKMFHRTDPTSVGPTKGNGVGEVKQATWVNSEKQPADDGNLCYAIPEDDNWTDQCIDFAVKTHLQMKFCLMVSQVETTGEVMGRGFLIDY
ncbi:putative Methyl-CpG-binding domain-containing protein [Helianthus annuus]|nr:putative Methyl-CpG-binding domain-containing protein [Helianthus annuus]